MSVIYIVLPLALLFAGGAALAFIWAARHGQFDDLTTPSLRILTDSELPLPPANTAPNAPHSMK